MKPILQGFQLVQPTNEEQHDVQHIMKAIKQEKEDDGQPKPPCKMFFEDCSAQVTRP